jgi:hypothetical protein
MRIFVSYASEDRPKAEDLVSRLRAAGHEVFFDRDDLPPGRTFDDRIRATLHSSDLYIFLITPDAVQPGYALSELAIARQQWRSPADRVLPVMLRATPDELIPPYLRAGTYLTPAGDFVADVLVVVANRTEARRQSARRRTLVAAGLIAIIASFVVAASRWNVTEPHIEATDLVKLPRDFRRRGTVLEVRMRAVNPLESPAVLSDIGVELEDRHLRAENAPSTPEHAIGLEPATATGFDQHIVIVDAATQQPVPEDTLLSSGRWRLCWTYGGARRCDSWQTARPSGDFGPRLQPVADPYGTRARFVAALPGGGFVLGLATPPELVQLTSDGDPDGTPVAAPGEITALTADGDTVLIGTESASPVAAYATSPLHEMWKREIPKFENKLMSDDDEPEVLMISPISKVPRSIARVGDEVWVVTGNENDEIESALLRLPSPQGGWERPGYETSASLTLRDLRLRVVGHDLWAFSADTSPASVYRIANGKLEELAEHGYDWLACANDVAAAQGRLLFLSCEQELLWARQQPNGLTMDNKRKLTTLQEAGEMNGYVQQDLQTTPGGLTLAVSAFSLDGEPMHTNVIRVSSAGEERSLVDADFTGTTSLAANDHVAIVVAEGEHQKIAAFRIDYGERTQPAR